MLTLALMAATETARAQDSLVGNIPFAFAAGKMALPAGEYRIQKVALDSSILLIERTDHAAGTVVMSFAAQANAKQAQSKLVFHRYDNRYFLSQAVIDESGEPHFSARTRYKEQRSAKTKAPAPRKSPVWVNAPAVWLKGLVGQISSVRRVPKIDARWPGANTSHSPAAATPK